MKQKKKATKAIKPARGKRNADEASSFHSDGAPPSQAELYAAGIITKSTNQEQADLLAFAVRLLSFRAWHHQVIAGLQTYAKKRFQKDLKYNACAQYAKDARAIIGARAKRKASEFREDSLALWEQIVRDPGSTTAERMSAQDRIDAIMGVRAPVKVAATDSEGNDVPVNQQAMRQAAILNPETRALMAELAEKVAGLVQPQLPPPTVEVPFTVNGSANGHAHHPPPQEGVSDEEPR